MTHTLPPADYRLYVVTSGTRRRTVEAAAAAAAAGAGIIQVRAKDLSTADLLTLVLAIAARVRTARPTTRVLVNDRADVAHAAMAKGAHVHGVHLGHDDLPVSAARHLLGPDALIGLTTGTLALVQQANTMADIIDYVGAGPFRPTPTKDSARPPLGIAGYPPLVAATTLPIVAIGDIQPADVPALSTTGIAGVAVVRAIMEAIDPGHVATEILSNWRGPASLPRSDVTGWPVRLA
ncbi:MAG TPA: thiamine phosphate synthase [Propionicimonas sp.]